VLLSFDWTEPGASGWPSSNMIHQPSLEAGTPCEAAGHAPLASLRAEWSFLLDGRRS
jgi:hypothetical protein